MKALPDLRYLNAVARVRAAVDARAFVLDVAAAAVVQRLLAWTRDRDIHALVGWTARTCERYGNVPAVAAMLRDAGPRTFASAAWCTKLGVTNDDVAFVTTSMAVAVDDGGRPLLPAFNLDETDALIDEFVVALDGIDPLTAEHSRSVASWCARIARSLELDTAETQYARRAGLLHDIGKIRIPPDVLTAPRKLTDAEWIVMRAHAEIGAQLIAEVSALQHFLEPIRHHHERLDGRGYPDGIPAASLPIAVRIVTVADGFNAMIAQRPYRRPLRPIDAFDELSRHAGTQFDPDVVKALEDVIAGTGGLDKRRPSSGILG